MFHKDIHGVTINQWDIVAVARNDTIHVCLVTELVYPNSQSNKKGLLVKRFDHNNILGYTPQFLEGVLYPSVISLMTSPVHFDMWNIRRELMNDSV